MPLGGKARAKGFAKGLLLLLALLACGLPVVMLAHPISYVPLIAVCVLVVLSWVYLRILRATFSCDLSQMAGSCELGQDVSLRMTLVNASVLPHPRVDVAFFVSDLFGDYDTVRTVSVALAPRESANFDFDVSFAHLGRYEAGVESVVLHDVLGLFSATLDGFDSGHVIVRPRLFDFGELDVLAATESDDAEHVKLVVNGGTDYASVREYRYGDPLKTVHWNLTARNAAGEMYTRLYETYVNPSACVVVDPFADPLTVTAALDAAADNGHAARKADRAYQAARSEVLMGVFDGVMEAAVSFSQFARAQGVECTVRYLDRTCSPSTACLVSEGDSDRLTLDAMRICELGSEGEGEAVAGQAGLVMGVLREEGLGQRGAGTVAFATSRIDDAIASALEDIAMCGRVPVLLLALPSGLVGRSRAERLAPLRRLAAAGVPYYVVEATLAGSKVVTA